MQNEREDTIFTIANGIFMGALIMAGIVASKLIRIGPFEFDAGLLVYAVTFVVTDIVTEVLGKKYAIRLVKSGFIALIIAFLSTKFALLMPHASSWHMEHEYETILGSGTRVFMAAMVSYTISQAADLTVFSWVRRRTGTKYLWLRNNLSTICGGGMDAIVFTTLAFYGVFPILPIIVAAFTVRILASLLDTPLVYVCVWWMNQANKKHIQETATA
jgi:uncharacterized integral membrane protein (TIGR00697 family)